MRQRPVFPAWLRAVGLSALALALSAYAWWPMLLAYPATQGGDGGFYHQLIEATRASVARYHELPLWNPYQCGGVPLWDNPQGISSSPIVWLLLPFFDTTRGVEVWYVLHSAIGFLCMWAFARGELRLSREAALVASTMFAFSGAQNEHLTGGHFVWVPYFYYPLALLLWRRAERDARYAVGMGMLVAWTLYEGGVYPLPHLALLLGAETLTRVWSPARILPIARAGAIVVGVGLALGASRFLPVYAQLHSHVRPLGSETDALQWSTLKDMFLSRDHGRAVPGQQYVWPEFGDYFGPILLALALLGVLCGGTEYAWLAALLVVSMALMAGHRFELWPWPSWNARLRDVTTPWSFLKEHVYPFKQMRVPSRFNNLVNVFLAAYAGIAVERVTRFARRFFARPHTADAATVAVLTIALVGAGDMVSVGISWCSQCFNGPAQDRHLVPSPRLYLGGAGLASFLDEPHQNRGRLDCWEEWAFETGAPLWQGDVPQAKASDDGAATVTNVTRTQNTFAFDVNATRPTRVLLNSAYDAGWRASDGQSVREGHQLAVDVPYGTRHIVVKYWPYGLTLGLVISVLAWLGVITFFLKVSGRRPSSPPA